MDSSVSNTRPFFIKSPLLLGKNASEYLLVDDFIDEYFQSFKQRRVREGRH